MALAGIKTVLPFDEVVDALRRVGDSLPYTLKETALGGLAICPTAKKITESL
jgi:L-serine dehydratase